MKITVNSQSLKSTLAVIAPAMKGKTTLPILTHVLLTAKEGVLSVFGTDLDLYVTDTCECTQAESGELAVEYIRMKMFIDSLGDAPISIESVEANKDDQNSRDYVILRSKGARVSLPYRDAQDYPPCVGAKEFLAKISSNVLAEGISAVQKTFTAPDKALSDPWMGGLEFCMEDDTLSMMTVDLKHRMSIYTATGQETAICNIIILRKGADAVLTACKKLKSDDLVEVFLSQGIVEFRIGKSVVASGLINGKFPDYRNALEKLDYSKNPSLLLNQRIEEAAKRVFSLTRDDEFDHVIIELEPNTMTVHSENPQTGIHAKEEIPVEYSGPATAYKVDGNYLLAMLEQAGEGFLYPAKNMLVATKGDEWIYAFSPMQM